MRITADRGACQGYGNCAARDALHFDLDDDGLVVVLDQTVQPSQREDALAAIRSCPVTALALDGDDAA